MYGGNGFNGWHVGTTLVRGVRNQALERFRTVLRARHCSFGDFLWILPRVGWPSRLNQRRTLRLHKAAPQIRRNCHGEQNDSWCSNGLGRVSIVFNDDDNDGLYE